MSETRLQRVRHTFAPVYDETSRILLLGTFPSVKSRENQFYYGHPQNRFWKVLSAVTGAAEPCSVEEKKRMLLAHHIAVWDVIAACDIQGSSDSSIRNVKANPVEELIRASGIDRIFGNGEKACRLYERYCQDKTGMPIYRLPSTSPANASYSLEGLVEHWNCIL